MSDPHGCPFIGNVGATGPGKGLQMAAGRSKQIVGPGYIVKFQRIRFSGRRHIFRSAYRHMAVHYYLLRPVSTALTIFTMFARLLHEVSVIVETLHIEADFAGEDIWRFQL